MSKSKVKTRPITEAEFNQKLFKKFGDSVILVGRFSSMNVKTQFRKFDGQIFEATPSEILKI